MWQLAGLDWATTATLATAFGTLVLAVATFAAVRSANRATRISEAAYSVTLRPVLVTSRPEDTAQKVRWMDDHWVRLEGGQGTVEFVDGRLYFSISLRNVGAGLAVPFGWHAHDGTPTLDEYTHAEPDEFRLQQRDLYVAPNDIGFWQAAIRERDDPDFAWLSQAAMEPRAFLIEIFYGDADGGQRTITRFGMIPVRFGEDLRWYPSVARHWYLDRPDPR
ncbi:MAG TPA: hypothetical protein VMF35_00575 [Acidimicrobiales bacterium]|nr:hypothetical protein [Acidimicrobiales bacterium]